MVNKSYFCYGCQQSYKKMMQVSEFEENGIQCDQCGSDFCEAQEASTVRTESSLSRESTQNNGDNSPPRLERFYENIHDTSLASDQYGRPVQPGQRRHEEAKQGEGNVPSSAPASPPNTSPQRDQRSRIRVVNPFEAMFQQDDSHPGDFFNDPFFNLGGSRFFEQSGFGRPFQNSFRSNARTQSQQQDSNGPQSTRSSFVFIQNGVPMTTTFFRDDQGADGQFQSFADLINAHMQRQTTQRRRATSETVINNLPVEKIDEKHCKKDCNGALEAPTCSVCISDFEKGQEAMFLPCGHAFHPNCIKPWLQNNDKCPVCRKELPKH